MSNRLISMAVVLLGAMMLSACGQSPDNTGAASNQAVENAAVQESAEAAMEEAGADTEQTGTAMEQQAADVVGEGEAELEDGERGRGVRHD